MRKWYSVDWRPMIILFLTACAYAATIGLDPDWPEWVWQLFGASCAWMSGLILGLVLGMVIDWDELWRKR